MQASQRPTRDTVMRALLDVVQQRIGEILVFNEDGDFHVQKSLLPKGYNREFYRITGGLGYGR